MRRRRLSKPIRVVLAWFAFVMLCLINVGLWRFWWFVSWVPDWGIYFALPFGLFDLFCTFALEEWVNEGS